MNEREIMGIMQSDMQLWEQAVTTDEGEGVITKTLDLPWGIGPFNVTLEGMTNAEKRRAAVASFGETIRAAINDKIGDEAITARANQAVATVRAAGGVDYNDQVVQPYNDPVVQPSAQVVLPTANDILDRINEIKDYIAYTKKALTLEERELRALVAFRDALGLESLPDAEPETSEDSSFHKEADLDTGGSEGSHSSADASQNLGMPECGQKTTEYD